MQLNTQQIPIMCQALNQAQWDESDLVPAIKKHIVSDTPSSVSHHLMAELHARYWTRFWGFKMNTTWPLHQRRLLSVGGDGHKPQPKGCMEVKRHTETRVTDSTWRRWKRLGGESALGAELAAEGWWAEDAGSNMVCSEKGEKPMVAGAQVTWL